MADSFLEPRFWLALFVVMLFGAFGGIAYELLLRGGTLEMPHRIYREEAAETLSHAPVEVLIDLGFLGRAIVGAAAAVTVLLVVAPAAANAVPLSVAAGAAAPAIIRLMRKQVVTLASVLPRTSRNPRRSTRTSRAASGVEARPQRGLPGPVPA
jgi:hypothetical protein